MQSNTDDRLPKRKGPGKEKNTIADLLKLVLDPDVKLSQYVAADLSKIPPVGIEDIDAVTLCVEMTEIRARMKELFEWKENVTENLAGTSAKDRTERNSNQNEVMGLRVELQPKQTGKDDSAGCLEEGVRSYADAAGKNEYDWRKVGGITGRRLGGQATKRPEVKVGKSTSPSLRVAVKHKSFDLYLSGLEADETEENVVKEVKDKLAAINVDIKCEKLKARQNFYSSFHIKVQGADGLVSRASEILESPDTWTEGIIFRRFWVKRESNNARADK
jgi:hypothetical protein